MVFSRIGYLIKIGIRGFLWHDLFPGWKNGALWGRLPTWADTIIPGITCTWSAEYYHIKTYLIFFPLHLLTFHLLLSGFHFSLLHLINADLAPVIAWALSICHACVMGPIFGICEQNLSLCVKQTCEAVGRRASMSIWYIFILYFLLLSIYPIVAWYKYSTYWQWQCFMLWTNNTCIFYLYACILHFLSPILAYCIFFLHMSGVTREQSFCVFIFHLPNILMISHFFPVWAMMMMHIKFRALQWCKNPK